MNCFDTAPGYGNGHSEKVLGRALKGKRQQVVIATKCGLRWDDSEGYFFFEATDSSGNVRRVYRNLSRNSIIYECEQSLKRLQTDVIDLYQCHWPDETTPLEETMEALIKLKKEGKIRAIGVSNFTIEMIKECLRYDDIASAQPKYNLLTRDIEKDVLPFCRENNIGIISYGPIAQGLLTGKVTMDRKFHKDDLREKFQTWFQPANKKRVIDLLPDIEPIAERYDATLGQLSINWVIREPGITSAIVGARNPEQVAENAKAADFELSEEDRALLREKFEALGPPLE